MEGSYEVTESEDCVVLTPSTSSAHFLPPPSSLAESKRGQEAAEPQSRPQMRPHLLRAWALPEVQDVQRQLGRAQPQLLATRPPRAEKPTERHNSRVTISDRPAHGLALRRFTSRNTTFTQLNSCCGFCPSQNTLVQSPNVFLARPDSDRLSIMTFSEIGSGSLKRNGFDRCLGLQLHKSRYSE